MEKKIVPIARAIKFYGLPSNVTLQQLRLLALVQPNLEAEIILNKSVTPNALNIKRLIMLSTGNAELAEKLENEFLLAEVRK